jgi:hypothetical protein
MTQTASTAQAIDTQLAQLHAQAARIEERIGSTVDRLYRMAGYRPVHEFGRRPYWKRAVAEMLQDIGFLIAHKGDERNLMMGERPSKAKTRYDALLTLRAEIGLQIDQLDAIYDADPWPRYFPCLTNHGHIHSSLRGCRTVRWDSLMGWHAELSGKPVDLAVAELGPILCTVCFEDAPVEYKRDPAEYHREQVAAKDRRYAALRELGEKYQTTEAIDAAGREQIAADIEKLLDLGKTETWKHAIKSWAAAARDEENTLTWAYCQYGVYAGHAA